MKNAAYLNKRWFSSNHEAEQKHAKMVFGVMKGQFQIIRREMWAWELDDVVLISNTCVILHNLILCMKQNADFRDVADGANLIM